MSDSTPPIPSPEQLSDDELRALTDELERLSIYESPAAFAETLSRRDAEKWLPYHHLLLLNEKLMDIAEGRINRLIVTMPPRHGKSEMCSKYFPAWFLNRWPEKRVILCSYGDDFAAEWGRKVRDLIRTHTDHLQIRINEASKAADRWDLEGHRGGMKTAGVGGQITGRGAHILIIDDPVKDAAEANSATIRDQKWDWWRTTARTRLEPGGAVIIIQCMTGDTPVLMATGAEKPLASVRPGDQVATYDNGKITTSTVRNWCSQGLDRVFAIRMTSGVVVKANARHPFLTELYGVESWKQTKELKPGDTILRASGGSGWVSSVRPRGANFRLAARACATPTTTRHDGRQASDLRVSTLGRDVTPTFATATASASPNTNNCSQNRVVSAPSAEKAEAQVIGEASFALTIATTPIEFADSCATTATLLSDTPELPKCSVPPLSTYNVVRDTVLEVVEAGVEEVFDLQIDGTENFIANGLVSHNTRWHEDDLTGRILKDQEEDDPWTVINLPAIAETDDPMGRTPGEALCPERYDINALAAIKQSVGNQAFSALYQQRPQPEGGGAFKRSDFRYWTRSRDMESTYILETEEDGNLFVPIKECWRFITMDLALTTRQSSDYTVAAVWDVAPWLTPTRLILTHLHRERLEGAEHLDLVKRLWDQWRPAFIGIEEAMQGSMTLAVSQRSGIIVRPLKHKNKDKAFRAKDAELLVENHRVYFPKKAQWLADFEHELLLFPTGTHDDQVDVFSYAASQILRNLNMARPEKKPDVAGSLEDRVAKYIKTRNQPGLVDHPVLGRIR